MAEKTFITIRTERNGYSAGQCSGCTLDDFIEELENQKKLYGGDCEMRVYFPHDTAKWGSLDTSDIDAKTEEYEEEED